MTHPDGSRDRGIYRVRESRKMNAKAELRPHHFSCDLLPLIRDDETGARFWSVSLSRTQLTYFEVEANCRFDGHSHPSEQITFVLAGELFFETVFGITRVGAGEVIAIPANVRHAVYTAAQAAKAVDAWSPVNKKYLHGLAADPPQKPSNRSSIG
jgi:quercetin dioxygenase-like cupin family protein